MPVKLSADVATLSGAVTVDEAQPLADWLRRTPEPAVRLASCTHLHAAALQALLAVGPRLVTPPSDPFLVRWVLPLLTR